MADDDKTSSGGDSEMWLWLLGAVIVLALLSNATSSTVDFLVDDTTNVTNSEQVDSESFAQEGLGSSVGELAAEDKELKIDPTVSTTYFDRANNKIQSWFSSFSIFDAAPGFVMFSFVSSTLFLAIIIYCMIRQDSIMEEWNKEIGFTGSESSLDRLKKKQNVVQAVVNNVDVIPLTNPAEAGDVINQDIRAPEKTESENVASQPSREKLRWEKIISLFPSDNPNDWRQAIIDADVMLDDLLDVLGYSGSTVAEKLQQVDPADMNTLEDAWSAHKVRNRVAHGGVGFELPRDLFVKAITQFERVFREYHVI